MGWRFVMRQQKVSAKSIARAAKWNQPKQIPKWNIVKGDKVEIIAHKGKGEQGVVKEVIRKKNMVVIEGCRLRKRIIGASAFSPRRSEFIEVPIHVTNVMLVDPETNEPTKISIKRNDAGARVRVSKATGAIIPKPKHAPREREVNADTDTPASAVLKKTYEEPDFELIFARRLEEYHARRRAKAERQAERKSEERRELEDRARRAVVPT